MSPSKPALKEVDQTAEPLTLAQALIDVRRQVRALKRDSRNTFASYDYLSSERAISETREYLLNAGILVQPLSQVCDTVSVPPKLVTRWITEHVPSGQIRETLQEIPIVEGKGRPLDKAALGAMTSSWTYFLRDLLQLSRGVADDIDTRDDSAHTPAPRDVFSLKNQNHKNSLKALFEAYEVPEDRWRELATQIDSNRTPMSKLDDSLKALLKREAF